MNKFKIEILKPISIFALYIAIIGWIAQMISNFYNGNMVVCSIIPLIILFPIYLYYIYR